MKSVAVEKFAIMPRLIERSCGGWLAVSPDDARLRIGVPGPTEDEAREKFSRAFDRWIEILAAGNAKN